MTEITEEMSKEIDSVIQRYNGKPGALIPVLEECQNVSGYLPIEIKERISRGLNIPGSTIYGVVPFYSFLPWFQQADTPSRYVWEQHAM